MYYVYILKLSNNQYYTWYTTDIANRLQNHQEWFVTSTKKYRPLEMIYHRQYETQEQAMQIEKYLKKTKSRKMIEYFINGPILKPESSW